MRRKIVVCVLALTLTLSLGAGAAALQPVETKARNAPPGAKEWAAALFTPLDWIRTLFGAVEIGPPAEESETGLLGEDPSTTTQTNSINPDEPPTEAGGKITPIG